jgi:hypothetical protein
MSPDVERRARVALSVLAKPGDPVLGAALRARTAAEVLALVTGADADGEALLASEAEDSALSRAVQRWRDRLGEIPSTARLVAASRICHPPVVWFGLLGRTRSHPGVVCTTGTQVGDATWNAGSTATAGWPGLG